MSDFSLSQERVAAITLKFVDALEALGYLCPPAVFLPDSIISGYPTPLFRPDERTHDREALYALYKMFESLEREFNPDSLNYSNQSRVCRLTAWAQREHDSQLCWKRGSREPQPRVNWKAALGLAMAVDAIRDWWHMDTRDGQYHNRPQNLPRGLAQAMWAAATILGQPGAELPTFNSPAPLSPNESRETAARVVLLSYSIATVAPMAPGVAGPMLLSLRDDLLEASGQLPLTGWEAGDGAEVFTDLGITAASAHRATIELARRTLNAVSRTACQARCHFWGPIGFEVPLPLGWNGAASRLLTDAIYSPLPNVSLWLAHLDAEAVRFRAGVRGAVTAPPNTADGTAAPGQKEPTTPQAPTIWYHGERSYSTDKLDQVVVTTEEDSILTVFREKDIARTSADLEDASGVTNASRVIAQLTKGYGDRFAQAIRTPGGKGRGGYYIRVRCV